MLLSFPLLGRAGVTIGNLEALVYLTSAAFVQFFLSYSANIRASLEVFGVCVTCCMARLLAKMANQLRITLACDVANFQREHAKKPGGRRQSMASERRRAFLGARYSRNLRGKRAI